MFEPSGRRDQSQTLTRPIRTRPLAIGLRSPAGDDAVAEGQPASARHHRARRRRQAHRREGPALGIAARDAGATTGIRSTACGATACRCATSRSTAGTLDIAAGGRGDAVADAAGRALSLGGHATARAARNRACASMSAGMSRPSCPTCPTSCRRRSTRRATSRATPPSCSSRRRSPARPSWRSPPTKVISLRSFTLPEGGTTLEIPVDGDWGSGVYALVTRLPAAESPRRRPAATAPRPRGPGRAVGVAWLGIDPAPRTLARDPVRARRRAAARPGRGPGQGRRARRRRGSLCDARRGRRGGAEADRFRQPGAGEILSSASASSGSNCATFTAG